MKIDTDKLLTIEQAGERLGTNKRAVYRAIKRAAEAGKTVTVELFGRTLVPAEAVAILEQFYFPYYSESHQRMVKKWGAMGGTQKKRNRQRQQ